MVSKFRRLVNPPYSKADYLVIFGTLMVLLSIPIILMAVGRNGVAEPAQATKPTEAEIVEDQTLSLLALNTDLDKASSSEKKKIINLMNSLAEERKERLSQLAESDPGQVLKVTYPDEVKEDLPKQIQKKVEEKVDLEGTLEILHIDKFGQKSEFVYFLQTEEEQFTLHSEEEITVFQSGTNVVASGVAVDGKVVLDGPLKEDTKVLAAADTTGNQTNAVILVNFQNDTTRRFSAATARQIMFTNSTSVNNYYQESSYGKATLSGNVFGWYTLPINRTCDYSRILAEAIKASDSAINFQNYSGIIIAHPGSCGWAGLAYVGKIGVSTGDGVVRSRVSWIIDRYFNLRVVGHEIGHGFGAWHANAYECGSAAISSSCSSVAYGDPYDIMGSSASGHFNAYHKEQFAWFDANDITVITGTGDYVIEPYQSNTSSPKVIKVPRDVNSSGNPTTWHYLEWRQRSGFDSSLSGNVYDGALIHYARKYVNTGDSQLIDVTPATSSRTDGALTVGKTFSDSTAGVSINATSKTANSLNLHVDVGSIPCTRAKPTVTISPTQKFARAGSTATYSVSMRNNDSVGCESSNFSLSDQVPVGWSSTLGSTQLSLNSQTTSTNSWNVTSAPATVDGFYTISATSTNLGATSFTASKTATYVVSDDIQNPTVAITSPVSNATVAGSVTVAADASDDVAVTKVEFFLGGTLRRTDTTSPYTYNWDTTRDADARYVLAAKAFDAKGKTATVGQWVTVANNPGDTQKPSVPTNLRGKIVSSTRVDIAWNASTDNVGVTGYRIYRNNVLIKRVTGRTFSDRSLRPGKTYTYYIRAYDAAGNISSRSGLLRVTTPGSGTSGKLGDLNGDGGVNIFDLSIMLSRWKTSSRLADLNRNGRVDIFDLSILLSRWGT